MVYPKFLSRLFFLLFPIADHNLTGQTHQKYSWRLYSLFSYNQCITLTQISRNVFAARRGQRQSHEKRIVALAFAIRLQTLGTADKRGRSDALSVRFVRSVWKSVICARMFQGKRIIKFCEFLSGWPLIICALQAPPLCIEGVPEGRGRYKRSA